MSQFAFDGSPNMAFAGSRLFVKNEPLLNVQRVYQIFATSPIELSYNPLDKVFPEAIPNPAWNVFRGYTTRKVGLDFEQVGPGWNRVTIIAFGIDPTYDAWSGIVDSYEIAFSVFAHDLYPPVLFVANDIGIVSQEDFPQLIVNSSALSGNVIPVSTVEQGSGYVRDSSLKLVQMQISFSINNTSNETIGWQPYLFCSPVSNAVITNYFLGPVVPINSSGINPVCPFTLNGQPINLFYQAPVTVGFMVAVASIVPDTQYREIAYSGTITPIS